MGKRVTKKSKKEFAQVLRKWRDKKRMTQPEAAEHLGLNLRTLQNWEIARTAPQGVALSMLRARLSA